MLYWIFELLLELYTQIGRNTHSVFYLFKTTDAKAKIPMTPDILKEQYDNKKTKASILQEKGFCFILQPKPDHQWSKLPFRDFC